jgi:hypothetical protein
MDCRVTVLPFPRVPSNFKKHLLYTFIPPMPVACHAFGVDENTSRTIRLFDKNQERSRFEGVPFYSAMPCVLLACFTSLKYHLQRVELYQNTVGVERGVADSSNESTKHATS